MGQNLRAEAPKSAVGFGVSKLPVQLIGILWSATAAKGFLAF